MYIYICTKNVRITHTHIHKSVWKTTKGKHITGVQHTTHTCTCTQSLMTLSVCITARTVPRFKQNSITQKMCADEDATTTKWESHRISVLFEVWTSSSLHFNFMNRRCCVWRRRVVKGKRQSRGLNARAVWLNYVLRSVLRWATSQRASRLPKKAKESSHPRSAVPCIVIFGRTRVCVIWICVQYMNGYESIFSV